MRFIPHVFDEDGNEILAEIEAMTPFDAKRTELEKWQTPWTSEYISDSKYEKYAVKVGDELVALGAYEVLDDYLVVHIVYMEAHPGSNPTLDRGAPKYTGIGKLLVAIGIKLSVDHGFSGDVILEAKTSELESHYVKDFGALLLPTAPDAARRLLIADKAAKQIFFDYLV